MYESLDVGWSYSDTFVWYTEYWKKSYSTKYIQNNTQDREKASGYRKTFWLYYPLEMFKRSEGLPYTFQFSCSVRFDSLQTHGLQHARLPCPLPGACSKSCLSSQWCHPTISFSVTPFFSCLQSFPASGPFQMSQFFTSGGQSIGASASASVLPMNIQDWSPLGCTGWISLQSKGLSRVFSNTTVQKQQFFGAQLSL